MHHRDTTYPLRRDGPSTTRFQRLHLGADLHGEVAEDGHLAEPRDGVRRGAPRSSPAGLFRT